MEYCCLAWAGPPGCYCGMPNKLQKWICWTVGLTLATEMSLILVLKTETTFISEI